MQYFEIFGGNAAPGCALDL